MKQFFKLSFIIFLFFYPKFNFSQTNYYVSATYTGSSTGSSSAPFKTIQEARDYIRIYHQGMESDIIVNIKQGTYVLSETLDFDFYNSGKNNHYIIYQSEQGNTQPVYITGGKKIVNWTIHDSSKNIWKASIGTSYSRQLYVNDVKAVRARSEDNLGFVETKDGYFSTCSNIDFSTFTNVKDMEVVSNIHWRSHRIPVETVCGRQIKINTPFWNKIHGQPEFERAPAYWLDNSLQLLNLENEWYIDKQLGILYYKPINSINNSTAVNNLNIILPTIEKLIQGNYVSNIKFNNLVFQYTTWNRPSLNNTSTGSNNGFFTDQGDRTLDIASVVELPGAVSFNYCNNINITNNLFTHIGSTGLAFLVGCKDNKICTNRFIDISASAIRVGDYEGIYNHPVSDNPTSIDPILVSHNSITNNFIDNIANEYFSSIGILVTFARDTDILNNTIQNFPYTGISLGWGFDIDNPNIYSGVNTINNNRINCSKQFMPDAGGIYTLTSLGIDTDRTSINNNYILNQQFYRAAIYLDNSSSNINVTSNLIDIENNITIPTKINCKDNLVRGIDYWWRSKNITIVDNYYNDKYLETLLPVPDPCLVPCSNISVLNPPRFTYFSTHNQQSIIINSGQQTSQACN